MAISCPVSKRWLGVGVGLAWLTLSTSAALAANLGFEEGMAGPTAPGWSLDAADSAVVTTGDGPADFSVYAEFGIQVPPLRGLQSLRLGTPKRVNQSQSRGTNTATSTAFEAPADSLAVTFRLFSLEHRGDDRLQIELLDGAGRPVPGVTYALAPDGPRPAGAQTLGSFTSGCSGSTVCELIIDTGRRNQRPADSGPYRLTIALPATTAGQPVQLRYRLSGGENEAHASWAYFDNANTPPQARLRVNPGGDAEHPALEGDFVIADCLQSIDPDGDDIDCHWTLSGAGLDVPATATGPLAVFWLRDQTPSPTLRLTVSDASGLSATATRVVQVLNAQPVVNALNVEKLPDRAATTVCRFADAGIGAPRDPETHDYRGTAVLLDAAEEHVPSFSSGRFLLSVDASGTCTVADKDGAVGSDDYLAVTVDPESLPRRLGDEDREGQSGGNDSVATAYPLEVDWTYLGAISDPADLDLFEIRRNGAPLPAGSEVVVSLADLPADYDLIVLSDGGSTAASPFVNAPFVNAPFVNAPYFDAPFVNAPFVNAQFDSVPFFNAPFVNAPFVNAPFVNAPVRSSPFVNAGAGADAPFKLAFSELPLSEVGLAAPGGSNVSNSDISIGEVGSLSLRTLQATPGLSLKGLSAEPGTRPERLLVNVAPGETALYVAVVGNQLAYSATRPYALSIEAATPPSQARLLAGTGLCDGERQDPTDPSSPLKFSTTWAAPGDPVATSGRTLILTQRERLELEQDGPAQAAVARGDFTDVTAYWTDFWAGVETYAASVGGTVVSVPGHLFEAADRNPCSVATRNALAAALRDTYVIAPGNGATAARLRNPQLESLVIVGGQNVIPLFAVPDESVVGNERDFTTDLWVRPGTPLSVATAEGYNLTDAAYADVVPTPFRGRWLYLEDRPVARLVESPETILADLGAYLTGTANVGRLAMGYDFFCDGTAEAAAILGVTPINGPPCDNASPWTAETLRHEWLAGGTSMCLAPGAPAPLELAVVNAHMTTYAALSALGFETGVARPPLLPGFADTVGASESQQCLTGTTTATIGCHSGLNIPDAWAIPTELGLPFDAAQDWVEALGNLVAPRGYGLGDNTVSNRGSEGILTLMLEELAAGQPLGMALVNAKRRYVLSLREIDVHDEDSLINLALFGPPQLHFDLAAPPLPAAAATATSFGTLELKLLEGNGDGTEHYLLGSAGGTASFDLLALEDDQRGTWFEVRPGTAQATYGRPLLPATLPIENRRVADGDTRIHGVALVSRDAPQNPCPLDGRPRDCRIAARFVDLADADADGLFDFNPVLPLPQHDWVVPAGPQAVPEPRTCVEAMAPTQLGVASTLDDGTTVAQSLVVGAGQFRCEPDESLPSAPGQTVGQYRLYRELQLTALHPLGSDAAEQAARDTDFDPPQVLRQTVVADPEDDSVTATLQATDALTGGSGISEIIALVYWEGDHGGPGAVESYSAKPTGSLSTEPFAHTFVLPNARHQRLAFQYVDGAGNLTQKSLKGSLFQVLDVQILTTLIRGTSADTVAIRVGDYCSLESPSISYQVDDGTPVLFSPDAPPEGVTVTVRDAGDPAAPCDRVIVLEGLDLSAAGAAGVTLTVEIRGVGALGSDTARLTSCTDPDEPGVRDEADILACGFAVADGEVQIDMYLAGVIDADVQYRLDLPDLNAQFKYFKLGRTTSPGGVQLRVDVLSSTPGGSQLRFRIRNLEHLGWHGQTPLRFQESTQTGEPGNPGQGFPDETAVFTGTP